MRMSTLTQRRIKWGTIECHGLSMCVCKHNSSTRHSYWSNQASMNVNKGFGKLRVVSLLQFKLFDTSMDCWRFIWATLNTVPFYLHVPGEQYKWLERDLATVDRCATPWLVAVWHPPWYSTYKAHYREAECMRVAMEDLLYSYSVDIVFSGHVRVTLTQSHNLHISS